MKSSSEFKTQKIEIPDELLSHTSSFLNFFERRSLGHVSKTHNDTWKANTAYEKFTGLLELLVHDGLMSAKNKEELLSVVSGDNSEIMETLYSNLLDEFRVQIESIMIHKIEKMRFEHYLKLAKEMLTEEEIKTINSEVKQAEPLNQHLLAMNIINRTVMSKTRESKDPSAAYKAMLWLETAEEKIKKIMRESSIDETLKKYAFFYGDQNQEAAGNLLLKGILGNYPEVFLVCLINCGANCNVYHLPDPTKDIRDMGSINMSSSGYTIHAALSEKYEQVAKLIVQRGVSIYKKTEIQNMTALEIAMQAECYDFLRYVAKQRAVDPKKLGDIEILSRQFMPKLNAMLKIKDSLQLSTPSKR
ncbi:MAG: hypothetical protein ACYCQI_14875 [Gammaproteobacteria bacterium]